MASYHNQPMLREELTRVLQAKHRITASECQNLVANLKAVIEALEKVGEKAEAVNKAHVIETSCDGCGEEGGESIWRDMLAGVSERSRVVPFLNVLAREVMEGRRAMAVLVKIDRTEGLSDFTVRSPRGGYMESDPTVLLL